MIWKQNKMQLFDIVMYCVAKKTHEKQKNKKRKTTTKLYCEFSFVEHHIN